MLRLVLAVVLAGALLAATVPALEDGRATATDRRMRGELTSLRNVAHELARTNDPVAPGRRGARRVVELTLPKGVAVAPVEYVELGGDDGSTLAYALAGGPRREIRFDGIAVRATGTASGPLVLREGGSYRLALELVRVDGGPAVVVRVLDADV